MTDRKHRIAPGDLVRLKPNCRVYETIEDMYATAFMHSGKYTTSKEGDTALVIALDLDVAPFIIYKNQLRYVDFLSIERIQE